MAKRNYGTVQREITALVSDLTSKDSRHHFHNMVNPRELLPLVDAIIARLPKLNGDYMFELLYKVCGAQTMGTLKSIEAELEHPHEFHDAFIDFMKVAHRKFTVRDEADAKKE